MADLNLKFLDLAGLTKYDTLSQTRMDEKIAEAISTSLKGVALSEDEKSLLFYVDLPVEGATAAWEVELPTGTTGDFIEKFTAATAGNVITVAEDGKTIVDSGIALSALAKQEDVDLLETSMDELKAKVDALEALVGVIPDGYEAKTIVAYIQEVADKIESAGGYDDTELQAKVASLQTTIDILNGDATTEGSVKKIVADEIAKIVAEAPESLDTLKEISAWITSHETDVAGMNTQIQANTTAIDVLTAYVGTIPEDAEATNVVDYITEALESADLTKYALASDLATAIDRIAANEEAIRIINASLVEGGTIYEAIVKSQETGDSAQSAVDALTSYVGHFVSDDESVDTVVAYIDAKVSAVSADIEARLAAVESAVATKAEQSDLAALTTRVDELGANVETNTTDIESLQTTVESIGSIPETDITALFDQ